MDEEITVNRIVRDLKMQGLICEDCTEEVKFHIRLAYIAGWEEAHFDKYNAEEKEVFQYDRMGNLITSYPSVTKAAKTLKCTRDGMYKAIKKGTPTKKGYIWKYADK